MEKPFVKNGLIYGVVSIIITLALYLVNKQMMAEWWIGFLSLAIGIYFMSKAVKDFKHLNGGYASFGEAFVQSFGTFFVSSLLGIIFSYLLYNVIDTGLAEVIKQATIEKFEGMEGMLGEEATEKMIEGLENENFNMTIGKLVQGLLFSSIFGAVLSLIIAAVTKNKRADFA